MPEKKQVEALRRAMRYLLAVQRVDAKKKQFRLTKEQTEQLAERRRSEEAAAESALRGLYNAVWLLRIEGGAPALEKVEVGGRPLQSTGVHERIMELLTSVGTPRLHTSVTPTKIAQRVGLGEIVGAGPRIRASKVLDAFYEFLEPPRIQDSAVLRRAISKGVNDGTFAWFSAQTLDLGENGRVLASPDKVIMGRTLSEDEIDFDTGWLISPSAMPLVTAVNEAPQPGATGQPPQPAPPAAGPAGEPPAARPHSIAVRFTATRDQLFKTFPALANLADKSDGGKITLSVEGISGVGFDPTWLRNAVDEPLDEADVQKS